MNNEISRKFLSKNPLVRWYNNRYFNYGIKLLEPTPSDIILDFGGGEGWLKTKIGNPVINYDIDPKLTDVKNYDILNVNKIFCSHSLEHLGSNELVVAVCNFKFMEPERVIVISPTENLLSKVAIFLFRSQGDSHDSHLVNYHEITEVFKNEGFVLVKESKVGFGMSLVQHWKLVTFRNKLESNSHKQENS